MSNIKNKHLKKKINLNIKTFYGNKSKIKVDVDITMTIQQLKTHLLENCLENSKSIYNLRIIYPMVIVPIIIEIRNY